MSQIISTVYEFKGACYPLQFDTVHGRVRIFKLGGVDLLSDHEQSELLVAIYCDKELINNNSN